MIVGIDPGLKGGICKLEYGVAHAIPMPIDDDRVAVGDVYDRFLCLPFGSTVVIEKQSYRPGQAGVVTNLTNYGRLLTCIELLGLECVIVEPKAWKKRVLGDKYAHDKDGAIQFCRDTYPDTNLVLPRCRTPHDGMADSVAIACFGLT